MCAITEPRCEYPDCLAFQGLKISTMSSALPITRSFNADRENPFDLQKFDRRDPSIHFYLPVDCPAAKKCPTGVCLLAHSKLEKIFHPIVYKTQACQKCKDGICEYLQKCAFYHDVVDKEKATMAWQEWEILWEGWRLHIESLLSKQNKSHKEIRHKVESIMKIRKSRTSSAVSSPTMMPHTLISSPLSSPLSSASTSNPFSNRLFPPHASNADFLMRYSPDSSDITPGAWPSQLTELLGISDSYPTKSLTENGRGVISALASSTSTNATLSYNNGLWQGGAQDHYRSPATMKSTQASSPEFHQVGMENVSTGIAPGSQLPEHSYEASSFWDSSRDTKAEVQALEVAEFCFDDDRLLASQNGVLNSPHAETPSQMDKASVRLQCSPAQIVLDRFFPDAQSLSPTNLSAHAPPRDNPFNPLGEYPFSPSLNGVGNIKNQGEGVPTASPLSIPKELINNVHLRDAPLPLFPAAMVNPMASPFGDACTRGWEEGSSGEPAACVEKCIHKQQLEQLTKKYRFLLSHLRLLEMYVKERVSSINAVQQPSNVETRQEASYISAYVPTVENESTLSSQYPLSERRNLRNELQSQREMELPSDSLEKKAFDGEYMPTGNVSLLPYSHDCSPFDTFSFFEYSS
ncbi:hypothetical protein IE077_000678 [Cardiosporidium cionae]|uniref:C3H1-type domain-containing protein n=1 Tax=Cardiosporidium cionae TaxID=476202 RepID=A0ABQ7JGP3_9APIC|nr:hypothetical protein IE077_000678 [Cardiosporidium cionae]|eukprot:KAF8823079.1 hypothetical protein IE077_000678 [Cardiosporidium cionae]